MMSFTEPNTIHQRLSILVDYFCRGNKTAFGRETDILPGVLASITGGRLSKPSFDLLQKIMTRYPEINGDWLLLGRGAMLHEGTNNSSSTQIIPATRDESILDIVKKEVAEQIAASQTLDIYRRRLNEDLVQRRADYARLWRKEAEAIRKKRDELSEAQDSTASKLTSRLEDIERAISILQSIKPSTDGLEPSISYRVGLKLKPNFSMPFDGLMWKRLDISEAKAEELFKDGGLGDRLIAIRSNEIDELTLQKILPQLSVYI